MHVFASNNCGWPDVPTTPWGRRRRRSTEWNRERWPRRTSWISGTKTTRREAIFHQTSSCWRQKNLCGHLVSNVRHCEPQREDDGQQEEEGGLFPLGVRPLQRQGLLLLLLSLVLLVAGFVTVVLTVVLTVVFVIVVVGVPWSLLPFRHVLLKHCGSRRYDADPPPRHWFRQLHESFLDSVKRSTKTRLQNTFLSCGGSFFSFSSPALPVSSGFFPSAKRRQ